MSNNAFIITSTGISLFFAGAGEPYTVNADHPRFREIKALAAADQFDDLLNIVDVTHAIKEFVYESANKMITIEAGVLYFNGDEIHSTLADRMIDMAREGLDIEYFENFMTNLMTNPSYRAVNELYSFLEAGELPITPDGHFLAYKKIAHDWTDCYTGTFDNSIGQVVSMVRSGVDEDKDRTCSAGLHFCSYDYLNCYSGQRVVVVKINPRDVVAIPSDYRNTKGRCCEYEVIRELEDFTEESNRIESTVSVDGTQFENDVEVLILDFGALDEDFCEECGMEECECDPCCICGAPDDFMCGHSDEDDAEEDSIKATDLRNGVVYWYDNTAEAAEELNIKEEYIKRVIKGQKNSTYGYKFEEEIYTP